MCRSRAACTLSLVLVLSTAAARAQPPVPRAVVKGQTTVPAGGTVILDARDSVCDPDQPVQWQPLDPPDLVLITADKGDRKDVLAFFVTDVTRTAPYRVAVAAVAVDPQTHHAAVAVNVVQITPIAPTPAPAPVPNPVPAPLPAPTGPLGQAAQAYTRGLGGMLRSLGSQIVAGTIVNKQAAATQIASFGKPFAQALDAAFAANSDTTGKITNPTAVQAALTEAATALGAP